MLHLAFLFCLSWSLFAEVVSFTYVEQPNSGQQPLIGLPFGSDILNPFQYSVQVSEPFRTGTVEVVFYNQFGQVLNTSVITHEPANSSSVPEGEDPPIVRTPNLQMFEGRTQLLGWARDALASTYQITFQNSFVLPLDLNNVNIMCAEDASTTPATPCTVTFTPPGSSFTANADGSFTPMGNYPSGTNVDPSRDGINVVIRGQRGLPSAWYFGPHVFQEGTAAGKFIFLDSDQGPPAAPFIDYFLCQGTSSCVGSPLVSETPRVNLNTTTRRARYRVVFNKQDIYNATQISATPQVPLTLQFSGYVNNNPGLWRGQDGSLGYPGGVAKPESNAYVDSWLLAKKYSNSIAPETDRKTTVTGPYPIGVSGISPTVPQTVYPDALSSYSYGSPRYPSQVPFPVDYPFGPSLAPGKYQTFTYNFTSLVDGNYEIWVAAEDVASTITLNGISPGGFGSSGSRIGGVTTVIEIIKDGVAPDSFSVQLMPTSKFLILGDQDEPPLAYDQYQAEIFMVRGNVADERDDRLFMNFDLVRDDGTLLVSPGKAGHFERILTTGSYWSQYFDFTPQDPNSVNSPVVTHPATGGQRGYQMRVFPIDPQENVSETTKAIYIIKDLEAPMDPMITSPSYSGFVITTTSIVLSGEVSNTKPAIAPWLDLREHGSITVSMLAVDSEGNFARFTTEGISVFNQLPTSSSLLDDDPSWVTGPGVLGGMGVNGKDFFGSVPYAFTFSRKLNLSSFVDGEILVVMSVLDQVGNPSLNTTSIHFIKDVTGPAISFDFVTRQNSGPDNNYPVPNYYGADDDVFLVSLISPEFTVDNGLLSPVPLISDPGNINRLRIEGKVRDQVSKIARIEIQAPHIPSLVSLPSEPAKTSTSFFAELDISSLLEGVREMVSFQAFDENNNSGSQTSIAIYKDTSPPAKPVISHPAKSIFDSVHRVYLGTDSLKISGILPGKDGRVIEIEDGSKLYSKIVILTPSTQLGSFLTGDSVPRIQRTSPGAVPLSDSFYSSFPTSDTVARWDEFFVRADGSFEAQVSLSNLPKSYTTPTTIWIQAVDQFLNTDPDISAYPLEIFYFPDGVPMDSLYLVDFPTSGKELLLYPPGSLPPSVLSTLVTTIQTRKFRMHTKIPMVSPPILSLQQFLASTMEASHTGSVDLLHGSTVFHYEYPILSVPGRYDGQVSAFVHGGRDIYGGSLHPGVISTVFYVDSLAPNLVTTHPDFKLTEISPVFFPTMGSRIATDRVTLSVKMDDFLQSNGSMNRSGVSTEDSRLLLYGPLHLSPDTPVPVSSGTTPPGFDLSVFLNQNMPDGVYRMDLHAYDKVKNHHRFYSNWVLDKTPVAGPLLLTIPENGARISSFPQDTKGDFVQFQIQRLDADLLQSDFWLQRPDGTYPSLVQTHMDVEKMLIQKRFSIPEPLDGSRDGWWTIHMKAVDKAGNILRKEHHFLLDTRAPVLDLFWPGEGQCLTQRIQELNARVSETVLPGFTQGDVSGISQASTLSLRMKVPSFPYSKRLTDEEVEGEKHLFSEQGSSILSSLLSFLPIKNQVPVYFGDFPSDNGYYQLSGIAMDQVGNTTWNAVSFYVDRSAPQVSISSFSDGKKIGVTNGFALDLDGYLMDSGDCHPFVSTPKYNGYTTLSLVVNRLDPLDMTKKGILFGPIAISSFSTVPSLYPWHSVQASYHWTTWVPWSGSVWNQWFEILMKAQDQAGNFSQLSRKFQLVNWLEGAPEILYPPASMEMGSVSSVWITSRPVVSFRWRSSEGSQNVEMELYKKGSQSPMMRRTWPAYLGASEAISLNLTSSVQSETFFYRFRGVDTQSRVSSWTPTQSFIVDQEPFFVKSAELFQSDQGWISLSSAATFLTSSQANFRFRMNKSFRFSDFKTLNFKSSDPNLSFSHQAYTGTTQTTHEFFVNLWGTQDPKKPVSRLPVLVSFSDLFDWSGRKMNSYLQEIKTDFGPDTELRLFSNPVSPFELSGAIRFVSHRMQTEKIRIIEGRSPQFYLKKNNEEKALVFETIGQEDALCGLFSIALALKKEDQGFYWIVVKAQDQLGREIYREKEISLGQYRRNSLFLLDHSQSQMRLSASFEKVENAGFYMISPLILEPQVLGEFEILEDLSCFGSFSLLDEKVSIQFSRQKLEALTHPVVVMKKDQEFKFASAFESFSASLDLHSSYFLARDIKDPEIEIEEDKYLYPGWNHCVLKAWDQGSGISLDGAEFFLDGKKLSSRVLEDGCVDLFSSPFLGEKNFSVEVKDRSGRVSRSVGTVQGIPSEGIFQLQAYPNPCTRSSSLFFRFGISQAGEVLLRIYDSASKRIYQESYFLSAGMQQIQWDLHSQNHNLVSNGVYFYRIDLKTSTKTYREKGKFAVLN